MELRRRPLDICIVVTYDLTESGGVKNHAFALADSLRRMGDRVRIIGPTTGPIDDPNVTGFRGVVDLQANGGGNALGIFNCPWKVRNYLKEHRFDVVHMHEPLNPTLPYWASWLGPRTAQVATFHAYYDRETRAMRAARHVFSSVLFPFVQRGIAVSDPARQFADVTFKKPLTIIPNGVCTRTFRPGPPPALAADGPTRLLYLGRLSDSRKGFRYLIDAYRSLLARGVEVTLDVVGDQGALASPPALPGITYHGVVPLDELAQRYRACDLFVAPSTGQESFGMVLLEAMASARPVICSDIPGYRQVVDEVGARLVPPREPEALADAIAALAADPMLRRRMGAWNRKRAEAFDWDRIALRVREEYLAAIAEVTGVRYVPEPTAPEADDAEAEASRSVAGG